MGGYVGARQTNIFLRSAQYLYTCTYISLGKWASKALHSRSICLYVWFSQIVLAASLHYQTKGLRVYSFTMKLVICYLSCNFLFLIVLPNIFYALFWVVVHLSLKTIFSHVGTIPAFQGSTITKQRLKCLAQEHSTVTPLEVSLEI